MISGQLSSIIDVTCPRMLHPIQDTATLVSRVASNIITHNTIAISFPLYAYLPPPPAERSPNLYDRFLDHCTERPSFGTSIGTQILRLLFAFYFGIDDSELKHTSKTDLYSLQMMNAICFVAVREHTLA